MIQEFLKGLVCVHKHNTMHCLIQVKDVEMELHCICWETKCIQ